MAENVRRDAAWAALRGIGVAAGITLVGMLALAALVVWAGLKDSALIALNQALKVVSIAAGALCAVRPGGRRGLPLGGVVGLVYIALGYGLVALTGTALWPTLDAWRGKLLFLETSEVDMSPELLTWILRNLAAQGIFDVVSGILVGKPARRSKYEPYKEVYRRVVGREAGRPDLPILYNVNIGHAEPIGVLPIGVRARLDADKKTLTLLESATA